MESIAVALQLIEKLIQLSSLGDGNRKRRFRDFVEPMYKDAQSIMQDYTGLFAQLVRKLNEEDDLYQIVLWIEERRLCLLPVRVQARVSLASMPASDDASMDLFQNGIRGLMRGGLSLTEEGYTRMEGYGWGDHTVLDLLYRWYDRPIDENRSTYVRHAKEQLASLQRAWQDVATGYAELKLAALG